MDDYSAVSLLLRPFYYAYMFTCMQSSNTVAAVYDSHHMASWTLSTILIYCVRSTIKDINQLIKIAADLFLCNRPTIKPSIYHFYVFHFQLNQNYNIFHVTHLLFVCGSNMDTQEQTAEKNNIVFYSCLPHRRRCCTHFFPICQFTEKKKGRKANHLLHLFFGKP